MKKSHRTRYYQSNLKEISIGSLFQTKYNCDCVYRKINIETNLDENYSHFITISVCLKCKNWVKYLQGNIGSSVENYDVIIL
jgi:hypothetical protein